MNDSIIKDNGQAIRISCIATGKPRPEVIWFKNRALITDSRINFQTISINATAIESIMFIRSGVSSDDGVYTCRGANVLPKGVVFHSRSFTVCVITSKSLKFSYNYCICVSTL